MGEIDVLCYDCKRKYTFRTEEKTELLSITKNEFKNLLFVKYNSIGKKILKDALIKKKLFKKKYKRMISNLKNEKKKRESVVSLRSSGFFKVNK